MDIVIAFEPNEEARLFAAARQTGLAPADLIKRLALEHLPAAPANVEDEIDAKLHAWQEQDGVLLKPDVSARALFAQWDEEDANMTEEERESEFRLWEDIEKGLVENNRVLQLRRIG